jgi:hypothetical protein
MLGHIESGIIGLRDLVLVLPGFLRPCGAPRSQRFRSPIWLRATGRLILTIGRSKTDQEGQGQMVPLPHGHCLRPVESLQTWLTTALITEGPVFRRITSNGRLLADPLQPPAKSPDPGLWMRDRDGPAGLMIHHRRNSDAQPSKD